MEHPAVLTVCVIGIPHKIRATLTCPRAYIVLRPACFTEEYRGLLTKRIDKIKFEKLSYTGNHKLCSLPEERRRLFSENIMNFVDERVPYQSRLTGGVIILDSIPLLRNSGKLDKVYLRNLGTEEVEIYGDRTSSEEEN